MRPSPFFRRFGCLFAVFNFLGLAIFVAVIAYFAGSLGLVQFSINLLKWGIVLGIGIVLFIAIGAILVGLGVRRVFVPLDDLLAAADRVAEGDYSARVEEKGTREVRTLARAFNHMAARLHSVDEQRRQLLADVTHELRNPLTVIQGNLEGMLDGVYPADETQLRALLDETNILERLVEDLRTLALAESGALQLKKEPTDLGLLVGETLSAFRTQAETAGVSLEAGTTSSLPMLDLDPGRIRQVLANLLTNALRYTPRGGKISLQYRLESERVMLEVQDSGPGIPAEDLPHVFERFYKSADLGGMGLGLAIARHLVEAHGGTITAKSTPGLGTTICISLPVE